MRGIERAPFPGVFKKLGDGPTYDSVVGRVMHFDGTPTDFVVKWNRNHHFASTSEAKQAGIFNLKTISLMGAALGTEHIVGPQPIVGEKRDNGVVKPKVYMIQRYVDGWDGRTLPDSVRESSLVVSQWEKLYQRLASLYVTAKRINSAFPVGSLHIFPITLTLGPTRRAALRGEKIARLPRSHNVLVDKTTHRILLFDFGPYIPWKEEMAESYQQIFEACRL